LGPIIRLPLERRATLIAYAGAAISIAAIVWLVASFEGGRAQRPAIIALYAVGMAVIALGAVLVPLLDQSTETPPTTDEDATVNADAAIAEAEANAEAAREEASQLRDEMGTLTEELANLHDSKATFELYEDRSGQYRWRLRHRNGNIIADSAQGYTRRASAQNGIESVRRNALGGALLDLETELEAPTEDAKQGTVAYSAAETRGTFELYEDEGGKYRWQLRHRSGHIIADSGEGYTDRREAEAATERVKHRVGPAQYLYADPTAFEVYKNSADEWRWRLLHENGTILADGGEGYASRSSARDAVDRVRATIEDGDEDDFEVFEDRGGKHRWRLVTDNGKTIADGGQGFSGERGARECIERVIGHSDAAVLDIGTAAFEVFEERDGKHRWRLRHRNGTIMADSAQGYTSRTNAFDGIESVKQNAPNAETIEKDEDEDETGHPI